jgi:hypothetical protein
VFGQTCVWADLNIPTTQMPTQFLLSKNRVKLSASPLGRHLEMQTRTEPRKEGVGQLDCDFVLVDEVGSGEFGNVMIKVRCKTGCKGEVFAVKKLKRIHQWVSCPFLCSVQFILILFSHNLLQSCEKCTHHPLFTLPGSIIHSFQYTIDSLQWAVDSLQMTPDHSVSSSYYMIFIYSSNNATQDISDPSLFPIPDYTSCQSLVLGMMQVCNNNNYVFQY